MSDTRSKEQQEKFPLRKPLSKECVCGHMNEKHNLPISTEGMTGKCGICICDEFTSIGEKILSKCIRCKQEITSGDICCFAVKPQDHYCEPCFRFVCEVGV